MAIARYTKTKIPWDEKKILAGKHSDLNDALGDILKSLNKNLEDIQTVLRNACNILQYDWFSMADGDTTPSVATGRNFVINNSAPTTITMFDDGYDGQEIRVVILDGNTTFDFSGTNLHGNAGVDWTPSAGDIILGIKYGSVWKCICEELSLGT